MKVFTDTGRRADSGRIEKDTDKREKERKQIKKENRVAKNLLLLNPGNLAKEVYTYGYHFPGKRIYLSLVHVLPEWE